MSAAMSETPDMPGQSSPAYPSDSPLSEDSKQKMARMAITVALAAAGVAVLATGILIGYATKKRVDKWAHAS
jgi:hypothetical protein